MEFLAPVTIHTVPVRSGTSAVVKEGFGGKSWEMKDATRPIVVVTRRRGYQGWQEKRKKGAMSW
jgi:hypothetical protein